MTIETVLIWMVVGLIAGWLAATMFGGGRGVVGDIVIGIVGAFIGGAVAGNDPPALPPQALPQQR